MIKFGGSVLNFNGSWLEKGVDLIPAWTLRLRFADGVTPSISTGTLYQRSSGANNNVWDWTNTSPVWSHCLENQTSLKGVIGAGDLSGVTHMVYCFAGCYNMNEADFTNTDSSISTTGVVEFTNCFDNCRNMFAVRGLSFASCYYAEYMFNDCDWLGYYGSVGQDFDLTCVDNMPGMFRNCYYMQRLPQFTFNTTGQGRYAGMNCKKMFENCYSIQFGALELYNTMSAIPGFIYHTDTFKNCGRDTTIGAIQLQQIPASWGGLGA